jgi:hypothetical protein
MAPEPLVCPTCSRPHAADQRFCDDCGMPLVPAGSLGHDVPVSERHAWMRKIKPQYSDGELVRVVGARHQAEAEFIQGLLIEEGVPSVIKRARGFDVPDMLSAGGRDVLVPSSGVPAARDVLMQAEILHPTANAASGVDQPLRILAGLLIALVIVAVIVAIGVALR